MMIRILCFLTAVFLCSNWVAAQETRSEEITAIDQMLRSHDQALKNHDLEAVLATFTSDAEPIVLGTGPGERWVGRNELADAYQHFFSDFDTGAMNTDCTWHQGGIRGDLAWLLAMCQVTDYLKNVERNYALNISAILEKENAGWRFRALHFSNLTGGEPPAQYGEDLEDDR